MGTATVFEEVSTEYQHRLSDFAPGAYTVRRWVSDPFISLLVVFSLGFRWLCYLGGLILDMLLITAEIAGDLCGGLHYSYY